MCINIYLSLLCSSSTRPIINPWIQHCVGSELRAKGNNLIGPHSQHKSGYGRSITWSYNKPHAASAGLSSSGISRPVNYGRTIKVARHGTHPNKNTVRNSSFPPPARRPRHHNRHHAGDPRSCCCFRLLPRALLLFRR